MAQARFIRDLTGLARSLNYLGVYFKFSSIWIHWLFEQAWVWKEIQLSGSLTKLMGLFL